MSLLEGSQDHGLQFVENRVPLSTHSCRESKKYRSSIWYQTETFPRHISMTVDRISSPCVSAKSTRKHFLYFIAHIAHTHTFRLSPTSFFLYYVRARLWDKAISTCELGIQVCRLRERGRLSCCGYESGWIRAGQHLVPGEHDGL